MDNLTEKYKEQPDVLAHLEAIENNIIENIAQFKPEAEEKERQLPGPKRSPTDKYRVNVLVDNSKLQGAPVIVEMNPVRAYRAGSLPGCARHRFHFDSRWIVA